MAKNKDSRKMRKVMREFKKGKLRSGSKEGPIVTDIKQAVAIGKAEERKVKKRRRKRG